MFEINLCKNDQYAECPVTRFQAFSLVHDVQFLSGTVLSMIRCSIESLPSSYCAAKIHSLSYHKTSSGTLAQHEDPAESLSLLIEY